MRSLRTLRLVLIGAALAVACTPATAPTATGDSAGEREATAPKRIAVAIRGDPSLLSGRIGAAGAGSVPGVSEVERLINGGLVDTDHEGSSRPQLAESVPSVENGLWKVLPDGSMETVWKIREGVKWHDGAAFTAADAVFTAQVERDPGLEVIRNSAYRSVERVESPDSLTVKVIWKEPFIRADTMFNSFALPMPKHLLENAYLSQKETFLELPFWNAKYVGTGAFRLKEWTPGVHAVLSRNPNYVLGAPKIDEIEVKFIPDPSTMGANILAGEVDLTLGGRLSLDWGTQIRDLWRDGHMVTGRPSSQMSAWPQFLNPSPVVLGNVQFRRALLHAVDRKQMIDSLVDGLSPAADSVVSPLDAEYRAVEGSIVRYPFDPRRAAQLLNELGYTQTSGGLLQGRDGPLRVEVRARSNDEAQVKTLLALADYWERAGVGVDQVHFAAQQASDREWRAARPGLEVVRQPAGVNSLNRYLGTQTPLAENRFSGSNRTRYQNGEFDGLIQSYLATIPMRERLGYAAKIVHHMTDQVLILNMFYDVVPTMISNRLTNVAGPGSTGDAHLWDVRQASETSLAACVGRDLLIDTNCTGERALVLPLGP